MSTFTRMSIIVSTPLCSIHFCRSSNRCGGSRCRLGNNRLKMESMLAPLFADVSTKRLPSSFAKPCPLSVETTLHITSSQQVVPSRIQIRLIPHDDHRDVLSLLLHVLVPQSHARKRRLAGDVVYDDGHGRVADVTRNEASEPPRRKLEATQSLLARRIPQLESNRSLLEGHRFGQEIDSDGGL